MKAKEVRFEDLEKGRTYEMYVTTDGEDGLIRTLEMTGKGSYIMALDFTNLYNINEWSGCEVRKIEFFEKI